ncbi:hypothetical protein FBQ97_00080 [Acidobacteria bacterium ACD]|nr:MAG: hypothetical protein EDX89_05540 [Acidobacteriota bacterium]MCE7956367.1 hypothetical protein [Acidobacteria bacterium ACB2]MDL1948202.1 hypothetical protein [Acidobacteria bacterium ACD]
MTEMVPARTLLHCPAVSCLDCNHVVDTAFAFALCPRPGVPQALLCRRCAARFALAPFRRTRIARVYWRDDFPRWAVTALWPGFEAERSRLTVAGFLTEVWRREG